MRDTLFLSHEISETRNIRGLEWNHFLANIERKAQLVVLNLVDAVGRLYMLEQYVRVFSFVSQENQVTGSRIPELQNRKFVFQSNDVSPFVQVIEAIDSTRRSSVAKNENSRTGEKSIEGAVFKGSGVAVN